MGKFIDLRTLHKHSVIINQVELEEVLIKRHVEQGIPIEDLFLVVNARPYEFSLKIDTKFGKLIVFAVNDCPQNLLLHHKKFPYPKINKVSSRPFSTLNGNPSHIS